MTISHSCCPGKTEMRPPEFEKGNTHMLPKKVMQEWVCTGCRTVIYTLEPDVTPVRWYDPAGTHNILREGG